jgi:hypothetical protein
MGAIKILRNQGRFEDAQWLENCAAATFGKGAFEQNESQRYPAFKLWIKPPDADKPHDTSLTHGRTSISANYTSKGSWEMRPISKNRHNSPGDSAATCGYRPCWTHLVRRSKRMTERVCAGVATVPVMGIEGRVTPNPSDVTF